MKEFTLRKLVVQNKEKPIFDVNFTHYDLSKRKSLLTTLIIGENGTGKSYLLNIIVEVFRFLEFNQNHLHLKYSYYKIEYSLNENNYKIIIINNSIHEILKNNYQISFDKMILPKKILAVSFMVNDKFTFTASHKQLKESSYRYLGARRTSNATWTTTIERKISELLISNSNNQEFLKKVTEILESLEFSPKISLIFFPKLKNLFKNDIKNKDLKYKINKNNISTNNFNEIEYYINQTSTKIAKIEKNNRVGLKYDLSLVNFNNSTFIEDYKILTELINLGLIESPTLKFYEAEDFDFEHTSSGEKHLLFTLINIASEIENNSIVLIDEPEISLHPNWQINYINNIKSLFKEYSSCHFILATHSHYLVSDLEPKSSSIIHMMFERIDNEYIREAKLLNFETYAWSAENVLYNIFGVRTTRNHYFEMDIRTLISLVTEQSEDILQIEKLLEKINKYILDQNDPIHILIEEVERYLDNVTNN